MFNIRKVILVNFDGSFYTICFNKNENDDDDKGL